MADQTSNLPTAPTPIPVFKGEGYDHWSFRLKTILRSRDLWEFVENGVDESEKDEGKLRNLRKKDAHAMALIQPAVHDQLFSRIASANSAKESWEILKMEFQGDNQVKAVKLQGLRREFENLTMREGEQVGDYFSRVMAIVSQKRSYGEEVADQVKLMGSLQSQEERLNSRLNDKVEKNEEHALQVIQESNRPTFSSSPRGRGRGMYWGRGHGRGNDRSKVPQCYVYKKYGHVAKEYSGCSNHMTGSKESFTSLDEKFKLEVQLGNKKKLNVEGTGTVRINTGSDTHKLLSDVYYVPSLEYNLLSVGQLMKKGYSLLFEDGKCIIRNNGVDLMKILVSNNNMFLLDATKAEACSSPPLLAHTCGI
ncbi:uncharacterized protein LOC143559643 [Bidens hawaiensis]|uniref:uncharacterized protein LOC143559643 n=1 Tax=Bidens hawaiensis TaxID=980011 RepID=UPI00404A6B10